MRVAYLFESEHAREILETMIIPQLEEGRHGVEVAGMMFFFDNTYMLVEGSDIGARLQSVRRQVCFLWHVTAAVTREILLINLWHRQGLDASRMFMQHLNRQMWIRLLRCSTNERYKFK